ncbi:hypothetical protein Ddc_14331 [Ditylenchus destructor]|nr:hypothetical protein Ddc_14331 [Ditylenchus destructor]
MSLLTFISSQLKRAQSWVPSNHFLRNRPLPTLCGQRKTSEIPGGEKQPRACSSHARPPPRLGISPTPPLLNSLPHFASRFPSSVYRGGSSGDPPNAQQGFHLEGFQTHSKPPVVRRSVVYLDFHCVVSRKKFRVLAVGRYFRDRFAAALFRDLFSTEPT